MPRAAQSAASNIINFFRKEDLVVASLVFELCKSALGERLQKSAKAKVKQGESASTAAGAEPPAAPVKRKKKTKKSKAAQGPGPGPSAVAQPAQAGEGAYESADANQEAGDLVNA